MDSASSKCLGLIIVAPLAAFLTVATIMVLSPNVPTTGFMVIKPTLGTTMVCITHCYITMTYKIVGTDFASQQCSSCDMTRGNNTDITIYYGLINPNVWEFNKFGSTDLAIGLYVCSFAWVLCVICTHYIADKFCATENGIHPTPTTSNVLVLEVRPSTAAPPTPPQPTATVIHRVIETIDADDDAIKGSITPIVNPSKLAIGRIGRCTGTEKDGLGIVIIVNP
jgi:hypothetical protein